MKHHGAGEERVVGSGRDWSTVPDLALFSVLMRLPSLVDFCSFRRVCTAWRLVAKAGGLEFVASLPPFFLHLTRYHRLYSMAEKRFYRLEELAARERVEDDRPPKSRSFSICGFSHGFLITRAHHNSGAWLVVANPAVGTDFGAVFPAWPHGLAHRRAYLTAPPTSPDCVLMLTDGRRLLCCRPGDVEWTAHRWLDDDDKEHVQDEYGRFLVSVTASGGGKVYGLTGAGRLVIMEFLQGGGMKVIQPEVEELPFTGGDVNGYGREEYRLVSHGHELLALSHRRQCWPRDDDSEVWRLYRLDSGRGRWKEAEEMGGRSLFANSLVCQVLEDPSGWGGEGDCIYFPEDANCRCRRLPPKDGSSTEGVLFFAPPEPEPCSMGVLHLKNKRVERWTDPKLPSCCWLKTCLAFVGSALISWGF